jgi:co-chaperonin GroES (HSP10)
MGGEERTKKTKMKANTGKVILRYRKDDLDAAQRSKGGLFLATHFNPNEHVCQIAVIEGDNDELNKEGFFCGDEVLVQYLVGLDEVYEDKKERNLNGLLSDEHNVKRKIKELRDNGLDRQAMHLMRSYEEEVNRHKIDFDTRTTSDRIRNQYFMRLEDNGDEIRWADVKQSLYGKKTEDGFMPNKGWVFCEVPTAIPERIQNGIVIPEQAQNTSDKGFRTRIVYIHPKDGENYGLNIGDYIMADKNTDAIKNVFGVEYIRVPVEFILATVE